MQKWWNKWGVMPVFDDVEFIKVTDDYIKKYKELKMDKITFCIPSKNNRRYLELVYLQ